MKKLTKFIFVLCFLLSSATLGAVGYFEVQIGDSYSVYKDNDFCIGDGKALVCTKTDQTVAVTKNGSVSVNGYRSKISLFGVIPIKSVNVTEADECEVAVLGTPFGIRMFTEGVLVVGYSDIETQNGIKNPAVEAGIKTGDIILKVNGKCVENNNDVQNIIRARKSQMTEFLIKRNNKQFTVKLAPLLSKTDNVYKIGIWIRDSSAGIGTLTFYEPKSDVAAGLGHGICDADTGDLVPVDHGQFVGAEIVGIKKSTEDSTGELQGMFSGGVIAEIQKNDITGVYGKVSGQIECDNVLEIALKQEVKVGKAQILTTLDDGQPKVYDCLIKKVYHNDSSKIKNMVIEVTDPELIKKTGGIVQGMSGSPIIQNGKLVGAVTHVFLNNCRQGYGIFAENMLETAQSVGTGVLDRPQKEYLKDAS